MKIFFCLLALFSIASHAKGPTSKTELALAPQIIKSVKEGDEHRKILIKNKRLIIEAGKRSVSTRGKLRPYFERNKLGLKSLYIKCQQDIERYSKELKGPKLSKEMRAVLESGIDMLKTIKTQMKLGVDEVNHYMAKWGLEKATNKVSV